MELRFSFVLPVSGDVHAGLIQMQVLIDIITPRHGNEVMVLSVG
jgi:hypothetical protein